MSGSTLTALASVIVAAISALAAYAAQRSAARASTLNTTTTTRVDMEREAYERARAFDTETIRRQDAEIAELRQENRDLHEEVGALRGRVGRLELDIAIATEAEREREREQR